MLAGYVCLRAIDRGSRYPRRLCPSLHATNRKKDSVGSYRKKTTKPSQGKGKKKETPTSHTHAAAAKTEEAGSSEKKGRGKRARQVATVPVPDTVGSDDWPSADTREHKRNRKYLRHDWV
jgi:hypothetical protein